MSDTITRSLGKVTPGSRGGSKRKRVLFLVGGGVGILAIFYVIRARSVGNTAGELTTEEGDATDMSLDGGYSPALTSYTDPSTGAIISGGGWSSGVGSDVPGQVLVTPSTNAQWVQQGIAYLTQQGFDPLAVTVALGKYIANQNLTNTELGIVQAAIAVEGPPPNAVPPPHVAPPSGQTPNTPVTGGVTKPDTPKNLHIVRQGKGYAILSWSITPGATSYGLHLNGAVVSRLWANTVTVHRNGSYSVASKRGDYTSPYSSPVVVKGI